MRTRTWGSSNLQTPECHSGALPGELQPRRRKRVIERCEPDVKDGKSLEKISQRNHFAEYAAKLAKMWARGEISDRELSCLARKFDP